MALKGHRAERGDQREFAIPQPRVPHNEGVLHKLALARFEPDLHPLIDVRVLTPPRPVGSGFNYCWLRRGRRWRRGDDRRRLLAEQIFPPSGQRTSPSPTPAAVLDD